MTSTHRLLAPVGLVLALATTTAFTAGVAPDPAAAPVTFSSSRITIAGTSNIHEYSASTTAARMTHAKVAPDPTTFWNDVFVAGALEAFELSVPVTTLRSGNDGLDKNMFKALKATEHPEIAFQFVRFGAPGSAGAVTAQGRLTIAGVTKDITLDLTTERRGSAITVKGRVGLLMTDYGVTPPKAMLGMLKTDPKVTVTFEAVVGSPLT